jgi:DNA polymerase-3 subunit delta
MSIEILKDQIKIKKLGKLYLLYGEEQMLLQMYLSEIEKLLIEPATESMNKVVLEGRVEAGTIIDHCDTLPFFAERKLVIVKNSNLFGGKARSGREEILKYFEDIPSETCLVFVEEEIDKRLTTTKNFKNYGLLVEFALRKPAELVSWAGSQFKTQKIQVDARTLNLLIEYCDGGMTQLQNEITKLCLYARDSHIVTSEDVERLCTRSIKSVIFDLTDAVAAKNAVKALGIFEDMLSMKEPVIRIFFMISRHFRNLYELKSLRSEGIRPDEAIKASGINPYAANKMLRQLDKFTLEQLKAAVIDCLDVDVSVKTGKIDEKIGVEGIILKYAT